MSSVTTETNATYQPTTSTDVRSRLLVNTWYGDDRLIAAAQPTHWNNAALETAADALSALVTALVRTEYIADLSSSDRINRAIASANETVLRANRARCGNELERHCGVGMAVAVRTGRTITVALVAPVQVILLQGAGQTWLPSRESWNSDASGLAGQPLGWSDTVRPTIFSAQARDGDSIVMTSGEVGQALAKSDQELADCSAICNTISLLCASGKIDPFEVVALSTRLAPPSVSEHVRSATGQILGSVDKRARSLWATVRTSD